MKTEDKLKSMIDELVDKCNIRYPTTKDAKDIKRYKKRIGELRWCLKYIQTTPTRDCLVRQLTDVQSKIDIYESRYSDWLRSNQHVVKDAKNPKLVYNKLNGVNRLNLQVKNLKFLLAS